MPFTDIYRPLRSRGCILGHIIGDSLGSKYQYMISEVVKDKNDEDVAASGSALIPILGADPKGKKELTDEDDMFFTLASSLLTKGSYDKEFVATAYVSFAQNTSTDLGDTLKHALEYETLPEDWKTTMDKSKMKKVHKQLQSNVFIHNSESLTNGFLARTTSLPVFYREKGLKEWLHFSTEDAALTHSSPVVMDAVRVYCRALHMLINGTDRWNTHAYAIANAKHPIVKKHLELSDKQMLPVPYGDKKHSNGDDCAIEYLGVALQFSFYQLRNAIDFESAMSDVIRAGGDTRTNACLTGALLGALYSPELIPEEWKDTVEKTPCRLYGHDDVTTVAEFIDKMLS